MAQQLDQDVASLKLMPEGDLHHLDHQLQHVLERVSEVVQRLQRQQNEMLRAQQLAAVGQLAASVAHEVRNPLTSIKMLVEAALRSHKPRPFTADNLRVVHGEILRLERTVQCLLDFARPPALQRRSCDLRAVINQAVELVKVRARQQQVQINVDCPEEPVCNDIDRDQVCTVLVNLLVNALDAMPTGGCLTVALEAHPITGIRLTVTDTGTGISAAMNEKLFTPFASSKATGSGLGLSISKRIIEEHGGGITATNHSVGGACFVITLPVTNREESHAIRPGH
jgi:signal transduction histidine kinase